MKKELLEHHRKFLAVNQDTLQSVENEAPNIRHFIRCEDGKTKQCSKKEVVEKAMENVSFHQRAIDWLNAHE